MINFNNFKHFMGAAWKNATPLQKGGVIGGTAVAGSAPLVASSTPNNQTNTQNTTQANTQANTQAGAQNNTQNTTQANTQANTQAGAQNTTQANTQPNAPSEDTTLPNGDNDFLGSIPMPVKIAGGVGLASLIGAGMLARNRKKAMESKF